MQDYKLSFLDKLDFVVTVREFTGADDDDALAHAYSLCGTHKICVMAGERLVGEVTKGAIATGAAQIDGH